MKSVWIEKPKGPLEKRKKYYQSGGFRIGTGTYLRIIKDSGKVYRLAAA